MANIEYYKVDKVTGERIDVYLLEEKDEIPDDYVLGWGGRVFFNPVYDWNIGDWVEGATREEIDQIKNTPIPKTQIQIIGEELVAKDIEIMKLNDALGKQIVGLDIRLMMGGL